MLGWQTVFGPIHTSMHLTLKIAVPQSLWDTLLLMKHSLVKKPNVSHFQIFGCCCHVHVPKELQTKLDAHSVEGIFCSFEPNSKAYRIWVPSKRCVMISHDVMGYEKVFNHHHHDLSQQPASSEGVTNGTGTQSRSPSPSPWSPTPPAMTPSSQPAPVTQPTLETPIPIPEPAPMAPPPPCRSLCIPQPSDLKQKANKQQAVEKEAKVTQKAVCNVHKAQHEAKITKEWAIPPSDPPGEIVETSPEGEIAHLAYLVVHGPNVPQNFHEAMRGPDADIWWDVMHEEIDLLTQWETWVVEELPKGRKEICCQWTYDVKYGLSGKVLWYKAQLVTQGFYQVPGLDYGDTFSPTVCLELLKIILHFAASQEWA
jgi:Reverse transcriptase (RNA-dependent DNA polymerase)